MKDYTKETVAMINGKKFLSEREINLIKNRMNRNAVDIDAIIHALDKTLYVTDEQAKKGLTYLRNKLLTKGNRMRKTCNWGTYELKAIGYRGEGETLKPLKLHKLFTFEGFINIGRYLPWFAPIYSINGVSYYMECGEPKIY